MSTLERFPLDMSPLVSPAACTVGEGFPAVVARVRLYTAVYAGVPELEGLCQLFRI